MKSPAKHILRVWVILVGVFALAWLGAPIASPTTVPRAEVPE